MIFTQLWPPGMAADVGKSRFSQGPGNPGNVMIYAAKIGHIILFKICVQVLRAAVRELQED
jgi:hypothetical protein